MIESNQEFHISNLLSFRKSLTQNEIQSEMNKIMSFIDKNNWA